MMASQTERLIVAIERLSAQIEQLLRLIPKPPPPDTSTLESMHAAYDAQRYGSHRDNTHCLACGVKLGRTKVSGPNGYYCSVKCATKGPKRR